MSMAMAGSRRENRGTTVYPDVQNEGGEAMVVVAHLQDRKWG